MSECIKMDKSMDANELHKVVTEYDDIVSGAGLGIWHIILKDGCAPRMKVSKKMAELLGIEGAVLTEEEVYGSWYNQIVPTALPSVQASVQEMMDGKFSENTYQWRHPQKGIIYVRCGGNAKKSSDGSTVISGYHSDVTSIVRKEQSQKRALKNTMDRLSQAYGIVKGFSQNFHTIWSVNKETAQMRLIRFSGQGTINNAVQMGLDYPDFDMAFERYVATYVDPEDRQRMTRNVSFDEVMYHLSQDDVYSVNYLRLKKDGTSEYHQITFANADTEDGKLQFVFGFCDVDKAVRDELEQKRMLQQARDLAENHSKELEKQLEIINTIAKIFSSIYYVDLKENSYKVLGKAIKEVEALIGAKGDATEAFACFLEKLVVPQQRDEMAEFVELSTLQERLSGKNWISSEFCCPATGWAEAMFIAAKRNADNQCEHVIWATRNIDDIKKREESLIYKTNTDEMTHVFNRRAYEDMIQEYTDVELDQKLVYVAVDVNGLKNVNDSLGHEAGDELIKAASECMRQSFGTYGKIFRIGGDEFCAIMHVEPEQLAVVKRDIEQIVAQWHGKLVDSLSISCGYVVAAEMPNATIREMGRLADERMYKAKEKHYAKLGIVRNYGSNYVS